MIKPNDRILADSLIKSGLLNKEEADKLLGELQNSQESLNSLILRRGQISQEKMLSALAESLHLEVVSLKNISVDKAVIEKVPVRFAWYYKFMPLRIEGKDLHLAVAAPLDIKVQDEIRVYLGLAPKMFLSTEKELHDSIKKYYGLGADTINRILMQDPNKKGETNWESGMAIEDIEKSSEDPTVAKLVNQIILEAYHKRATDIHIEPYRNRFRIRYRIDGVLVDANLPPEAKHFLLPICSRIKIMANLSIEEKRLPQDGSAVVKTNEQDLDLRVSTIPTLRGESLVIRILPTKVMLYSLEKLGLDQDHVQTFRKLVKKPHGIVFVTGPTGSGKTTTLYACLNEINSAEKKIITIEDPIEYEMEGVTQIQVNPRVNFNFSSGLRSVLRHDPDILMVGEVRDLETAEIAIRTALTGHLVFSTLHTNDAASGITRLIEMGLEPYLVASSIEAFVAQRLIRIICPNCKEEIKTPLMDIREEICVALNLSAGSEPKMFRGKGCDQCNHTGFYGRTAIYEILVIDEEIRQAILEKPRADTIKKLAVSKGMNTLRQDGWKKVVAGITSPSEVINVTTKEDYSALKSKADLKEGLASKEESSKLSKPIEKKVQPTTHRITKDVLSAPNEYEPRIYPRANAQLEIRYKVLGGSVEDVNLFQSGDIEYATVTKNISAGGLKFVSHSAFTPGSILSLKIHLEEEERSINCLAKVCRVEEDQKVNQAFVMVYFLDITSSDRSKLAQFVKSKLS